uniref:Uncharacterized protein n=2 Tax=Aegilops tauschii subsp. strangulata TaxID=200361 RepID=A0A453EGM3_AEGTS
ARSARVPRPHERREGGGQYGEAPRPHERREVKVQQRPIRRAAATARAPRGPGAEAANTARRCLSGDRRASAACSTLLLRLLPGLDLPPCVVPTRITKLPNGVRDSASPPRMSGYYLPPPTLFLPMSPWLTAATVSELTNTQI